MQGGIGERPGSAVLRKAELISACVIQPVTGDGREVEVVVVFKAPMQSPDPSFQWMADVAAKAEQGGYIVGMDAGLQELIINFAAGFLALKSVIGQIDNSSSELLSTNAL